MPHSNFQQDRTGRKSGSAGFRSGWFSLYLCGASVITCVVLGRGIGAPTAIIHAAWRMLRPICDMLQIIPLFVFLGPWPCVRWCSTGLSSFVEQQRSALGLD